MEHHPPGFRTLSAWPSSSTVVSTAALVCVTLICAAVAGCDSTSDDPSGDAETSAEIELLRPQVTAFCSACHAMPDPATFPRDSWHHEVEKAYGFFHDSERDDLTPPPMSDVVRWFRLQAPASLTLAAANSAPSPLRFRREVILNRSPAAKGPSISDVYAEPEGQGRRGAQIRFCDMNNGQIGTLSGGSAAVSKQAKHIQNPAHIESTDLDGDQKVDYLIAELGSYLPEDHKRGKVIWLRSDANGGEESHVLFEGVGRVADVRPGDFDGDGDLDLVVAEFGWFKTGGIHILRQVDPVDGIPQFKARMIDRRHGTINVPVTDLDNDGDLDFVALISQEYEEIAAFLNRGDGTFERQIIQPGSDPAYGSGGIELVDLDGDRDLDVLYVNGDSLDSNLVKPYHAVQWLENEGDFPFTHHLVDRVPGACRAIAGDLDNDGDLDIVVGAWIPPKNSIASPDEDGLFDTLLWFEQTRTGEFRSHRLTRAASLGVMAADLADLDGDGDLDIIVGNFGQAAAETESGIEVFWNPSSGG